jgi:precorrin-6B methylase 2
MTIAKQWLEFVLSWQLNRGFTRLISLLLCLGIAWGAAGCTLSFAQPTPTAIGYETRALHDPDGIGKFYLGREIAQVMGHPGAGWLERPSREAEEQPQKLVGALGLKPTDVVAEIGAGTGYISFRMAQLVPQGQVLAVDVQPEMIEILEFLKQERQVPQLKPILGTEQNPQLDPESIDLAVMVDAYHEFAYPHEMMGAIAQALKPHGRVALVEYRAENPFVLIKRLHKMSQRQVKKEMQAVGLIWQATKDVLPQQHLMLFEKLGK